MNANRNRREWKGRTGGRSHKSKEPWIVKITDNIRTWNFDVIIGCVQRNQKRDQKETKRRGKVREPYERNNRKEREPKRDRRRTSVRGKGDKRTKRMPEGGSKGTHKTQKGNQNDDKRQSKGHLGTEREPGSRKDTKKE